METERLVTAKKKQDWQTETVRGNNMGTGQTRTRNATREGDRWTECQRKRKSHREEMMNESFGHGRKIDYKTRTATQTGYKNYSTGGERARRYNRDRLTDRQTPWHSQPYSGEKKCRLRFSSRWCRIFPWTLASGTTAREGEKERRRERENERRMEGGDRTHRQHQQQCTVYV